MIGRGERLGQIALGGHEVAEIQLAEAELRRGPRRARELVRLLEKRQRARRVVVGAQLNALADQGFRLLGVRGRAGRDR